MLNCAYCDNPCQPTREHVIPRWYNDTPGEAVTFSARAPLTHVQGDLIVKDVCGVCNSGVLSSLDSYGKELYERYFAFPVYYDEQIHFEYDGERLTRWLLKLSFNSARAQNADVRVLHEYRKVILGESPLTDRIRCWLHLVSPTILEPEARLARPARRHQQGQENTKEPNWFRIGQFRLLEHAGHTLVQRTVLINSFAFTLLIAPVNSAWPNDKFDKWIEVFSNELIEAQPILPCASRVTPTALGHHAAASLYPLLHNYPTRFVDEKNPYIVNALKGDLKLVYLSIPPELIYGGDTTPIVAALRDMVSIREKATAFKQRIGVMVDGFDADPRELWQIPEAQQFFRNLFVECPFFMLLAHPDGGLLKLLAACWIYEDGLTKEVEQERMVDFLHRAFHGLNGLNHSVMLSEEQNREICTAAAKVLLGESPPN